MRLTEFFLDLSAQYDRHASFDAPAQILLRAAPHALREHTAAGIKIRAGGGKGMATYTPWVGFFDPDETDSPQRGIYLVYLMSEDLATVTLTLNQGMEYLRRDLGDKDAQRQLRDEAAAIRSRLVLPSDGTYSGRIELRSKGPRQRAYEAGNIVGRTYVIADLPSEAELRNDLASYFQIYEAAIEMKRAILTDSPGTIRSPSASRVTGNGDPLAGFRPKNSSDYVAWFTGRELIKTRRHERLVSEFAMFAEPRGFAISTEHPLDLVLRKEGMTIIVEAKVVYNSNATDAVRAATGQLLTYSYFLFDDGAKPLKAALFSSDVGGAYLSFLRSLDIAAVWWHAGEWYGTATAVSLGLVL